MDFWDEILSLFGGGAEDINDILLGVPEAASASASSPWEDWLSSVGGDPNTILSAYPGGGEAIPSYSDINDILLGYPGAASNIEQYVDPVTGQAMPATGSPVPQTSYRGARSPLSQLLGNLAPALQAGGGTAWSALRLDNPPEPKQVPRINVPMPEPVSFPSPTPLVSLAAPGGQSAGEDRAPMTGLEQLLDAFRGSVDPFAETRSRLNRDSGLQSLMTRG